VNVLCISGTYPRTDVRSWVGGGLSGADSKEVQTHHRDDAKAQNEKFLPFLVLEHSLCS